MRDQELPTRKLGHSALWRMAGQVRHGTTTGIDLIC
jgi:hypothetical protein